MICSDVTEETVFDNRDSVTAAQQCTKYFKYVIEIDVLTPLLDEVKELENCRNNLKMDIRDLVKWNHTLNINLTPPIRRSLRFEAREMRLKLIWPLWHCVDNHHPLSPLSKATLMNGHNLWRMCSETFSHTCLCIHLTAQRLHCFWRLCLVPPVNGPAFF